jgi:glutamine synthetase
MLDLVKKEIIPACVNYQNDLAKLLQTKKSLGDFDCTLEERLLKKISTLSRYLLKKLETLERAMQKSTDERDILSHAKFYRDEIFAAMNELRLTTDELETRISKIYWPLPSYGEMLYSVN